MHARVRAATFEPVRMSSLFGIGVGVHSSNRIGVFPAVAWERIAALIETFPRPLLPGMAGCAVRSVHTCGVLTANVCVMLNGSTNLITITANLPSAYCYMRVLALSTGTLLCC